MRLSAGKPLTVRFTGFRLLPVALAAMPLVRLDPGSEDAKCFAEPLDDPVGQSDRGQVRDEQTSSIQTEYITVPPGFRMPEPVLDSIDSRTVLPADQRLRVSHVWYSQYTP